MLDRRQYFVKERTGWFKRKGAFDILDPETKETIGVARETTGGLAMAMRSMLGPEKAPATFAIGPDEKSAPVVEIKRPWSFLFGPKVHVYEKGKALGFFKKKVFSVGGGLNVFDADGKKIGDVQGSWRGGTFTFKDDAGKELGVISKKWSGAGKEMFTSADNYMVSVNEGEDGKPAASAALLLAAAIVLDTTYYE